MTVVREPGGLTMKSKRVDDPPRGSRISCGTGAGSSDRSSSCGGMLAHEFPEGPSGKNHAITILIIKNACSFVSPLRIVS